MVLLAACTGTEPVPLAPPPDRASAATTGSTAPSTTTPPPEIPVALGLEAWNLWWQQWEAVAWPPGNDNELAPFTGPQVVESQLAFLAEWSPQAPVSATPHPEVTATAVNSMNIADCVLMVPPPSTLLSQVGVPVTGTLGYDGVNWELSSLEIASERTCVPTEMAATAVEAWTIFWQRWPEVWSTPDPAAPVIAQISMGRAQEYFEQEATSSAEQGWRLLGTLGELQPVATGVAETLDGLAVTVADCADSIGGFGTFDGSGGPVVPPLTDGQVWLARGWIVITQTGSGLVADWTIEPFDRDRCLDTLAQESLQ